VPSRPSAMISPLYHVCSILPFSSRKIHNIRALHLERDFPEVEILYLLSTLPSSRTGSFSAVPALAWYHATKNPLITIPLYRLNFSPSSSIPDFLFIFINCPCVSCNSFLNVLCLLSGSRYLVTPSFLTLYTTITSVTRRSETPFSASLP